MFFENVPKLLIALFHVNVGIMCDGESRITETGDGPKLSSEKTKKRQILYVFSSLLFQKES